MSIYWPIIKMINTGRYIYLYHSVKGQRPSYVAWYLALASLEIITVKLWEQQYTVHE